MKTKEVVANSVRGWCKVKYKRESSGYADNIFIMTMYLFTNAISSDSNASSDTKECFGEHPSVNSCFNISTHRYCLRSIIERMTEVNEFVDAIGLAFKRCFICILNSGDFNIKVIPKRCDLRCN